MPRVIVKCRYYKNAATGNLSGLMKYIALRDGAERIPKEKKSLPATEQQEKFINEIVIRDSVLKTLPEYKQFVANKTRGSASEFIASAVERNPRLLNTEEYLHYMAMRPGSEKISGEHGLFSSDDTIDLEKETNKLEKHNGNVYSVIVSVKREEAERLGYNSASRWRDMIRANLSELAKQHNIPITSLRWYGAFHNESHHPHVHILLYSTAEPDRSFIGKKGIDGLRHLFGTEIFKDDLREIYDRQTGARNKLTNEMRSEFKSLIDEVLSGTFLSASLLTKIENLAQRLNGCSGKKQYGYLPKSVKALVDEIVDDISKEESVARLYDLWYRAKCSVTETYSDEPPEKLPLSQEKAFKQIRNALVSEAARLGTALARSNSTNAARIIKSNEYPDGKETIKHVRVSRKDAKEESTLSFSPTVVCSKREESEETTDKKAAAKNPSRNKNGGINRNSGVVNAALRFGICLAQVFYRNYKKYDPELDDIDKQLRREIRAVKNGENMVM